MEKSRNLSRRKSSIRKKGFSKRQGRGPRKEKIRSSHNLEVLAQKERSSDQALEARFLNFLMRDGKKEKARGILRKLASRLGEVGEEKPRGLLRKAVLHGAPLVQLRRRRQGARTTSVPFPLSMKQRESLAMRWVLEEARKGKGAKIVDKLATVLVDTAQNKGKVVQRKLALTAEVQRSRGNIFLRWSLQNNP